MQILKSPVTEPSLKSVKEGFYGAAVLLGFVIVIAWVKGYVMTSSDWALYGGASFVAGVYTALQISVEKHGKRVILILLAMAVAWAMLVKHWLG